MSLFGRHDRASIPPPADDLHERLIAAARACHSWVELDRAKLVERDRGQFIHVESDAVYRRYAGDAFSPSGEVIADMTPLAFMIDENGLHVLERQPQTWSQLVYERERDKASAQ